MGQFLKAIPKFIDTIACDGDGCYAEVSESMDTDKKVCIIAWDAGWVLEYPQWFCPACAKAKKEG